MWAEVAEPSGKGRKRRPAIILTSNAEIASAELLAAVAASHSSALLNPLPQHCIEVPYHPEGLVRTKLRKPTVAVCNWLLKLRKSDILEVAGVVPPQILKAIVAEVVKSSTPQIPPARESNG